MKVKTNELTGSALDWAVAKCLGEDESETLDPLTWVYTAKPTGCWDFSTDPSQAHPIIERERISTIPTVDGGWAAYVPDGTRWVPRSQDGVEIYNWAHKQTGPTPLIAAMRCYVASKLGDEIEVPEELV